MLRVRLASGWNRPAVLGLPVGDAGLLDTPVPASVADLAEAYLADADLADTAHTGAAV